MPTLKWPLRCQLQLSECHQINSLAGGRTGESQEYKAPLKISWLFLFHEIPVWNNAGATPLRTSGELAILMPHGRKPLGPWPPPWSLRRWQRQLSTWKPKSVPLGLRERYRNEHLSEGLNIQTVRCHEVGAIRPTSFKFWHVFKDQKEMKIFIDFQVQRPQILESADHF